MYDTTTTGLDITTWFWNLHVDAHNFNSRTTDLEKIFQNVFSVHFGQLSNNGEAEHGCGLFGITSQFIHSRT